MGTKFDRVNPLKRVAYAFVGLLAGEAVLLLYLLQNALRERASLIAVHMGEPSRQIPFALDFFVICAMFSLVGWLIVGLPTALFLSARSMTRLSWPLALVVGGIIGPVALFAIFLLHDHGHIYLSSSFAETATPYAYSILVSAVSFGVYVALLRRQTRRDHISGRNQAITRFDDGQ
jgi:hypothetical protein